MARGLGEGDPQENDESNGDPPHNTDERSDGDDGPTPYLPVTLLNAGPFGPYNPYCLLGHPVQESGCPGRPTALSGAVGLPTPSGSRSSSHLSTPVGLSAVRVSGCGGAGSEEHVYAEVGSLHSEHEQEGDKCTDCSVTILLLLVIIVLLLIIIGLMLVIMFKKM
ncbi:saimiri transformation-associated protein [Saimiriine gammaherpesvirus 2]|uniref:Transforming protein STP n=1 Tax=Saimiriine herpesvirus 2 (strain 11) TaxID=10383 RepID=TSTP_SHV21|nr:saimiri transformation-associated protein [Saimiriine gammaherpesvirus 2]P18347.1 RecName: Full=Transforming protein STP [Herpesvirus saimiri (strain 11)]pir/TVBE11/ transforming protein stp - saimiriine herpesvirus 1 (strain 11) [Saimiriine alphaherpesvirus 1]AAA58725.1 transformation-associated protein [Saimiriine alphaherpesvirus 1]CAA45623.1 saimiri transformation-associated protein [Saimiriine gammaherpesvirus 2]